MNDALNIFAYIYIQTRANVAQYLFRISLLGCYRNFGLWVSVEFPTTPKIYTRLLCIPNNGVVCLYRYNNSNC